MRRSSLLTLTVLGALICLIGGSGLFAALNDSASTGTNSVDSAPLAASADIQLALGFIPATTPPNNGCGTFSEELGTAFFTASNIGPGYGSGEKLFCVRNVGSQPVNLSALATGLVDVDVTCSGDEAAFDDTCGDNDDGELSSVLNISYRAIRCVDGVLVTGLQTLILKDNASTPANLGSLAAGQTLCYFVAITYPTSTPPAAVQGAQSDRATWRITFTGQS